MSKKISSISKYLGLSQNWFINFQPYNKSYNYFFTCFTLLNSSKKIIFSNNFFISNYLINFLNNFTEISFKIYYFNSFNLQKLQFLYFRLKHFLLNNFFIDKLGLSFFIDKLGLLSNSFLNYYLNHLVLNLNNSPKKIFNLLIILLKNQLNFTKYLILNSGFRKVQLKGFKVQLKGRFELSKSTLAKTICLKFGNITTNSFNHTLELLQKPLYSKLGKSSIKIWLFYLKT